MCNRQILEKNIVSKFELLNAHDNLVLDIFQLHITLRFVRQRRLTLEFILEGRCQQ